MGHMYHGQCVLYIRSTRGAGTGYIHREVPGLLQGRGTPEGAQGPPVPTVRSTQCLHPESAPSLTNCPNGHSLNRGQPPVFRVIEVSQTTLWAGLHFNCKLRLLQRAYDVRLYSCRGTGYLQRVLCTCRVRNYAGRCELSQRFGGYGYVGT